jgi:hypothetical protein
MRIAHSAARALALTLSSALTLSLTLTLTLACTGALWLVEGTIADHPDAHEDGFDSLWCIFWIVATLGFDGPMGSGGAVGKLIIAAAIIAGLILTTMPITAIGTAFEEAWKKKELLILEMRVQDVLVKRGISVHDFKFLFDELDKDGSGELDWSEFKEALQKLSIRLPVQKSRSLFESLDEDRQGSVSYDEMAKALFPKQDWEKVREEHARMEKAAVVVQARVRGFLARQRTGASLLLRRHMPLSCVSGAAASAAAATAATAAALTHKGMASAKELGASVLGQGSRMMRRMQRKSKEGDTAQASGDTRRNDVERRDVACGSDVACGGTEHGGAEAAAARVWDEARESRLAALEATMARACALAEQLVAQGERALPLKPKYIPATAREVTDAQTVQASERPSTSTGLPSHARRPVE